MQQWGSKDRVLRMRVVDADAVDGLDNLEEARRIIHTLTKQNQMQGHLLVAWKRRLKQQSDLIFRLHREREEEMRLLSSQLLLLEANMRMKQRMIETLLQDRQELILQQESSIQALEKQISVKSANSKNEVLILSCQKGDESLEDSDSAVIIEDCVDPVNLESQDSSRNQIKIIRSISDVVENFRKQQMADYVEDPGGSSGQESSSEEESCGIHRSFLRGSLERCPGVSNHQDSSHHCSRIFSNHRSVTRPRDVKYRRNHHKTKSLEELRQKLKNWQETDPSE